MPILAKKKLFTTQYYDDYRKGKRKLVQTGMRPSSAHRRNNPHPQSDFLEPKNIKEQDAQMALQHRVQRAVQDYVLKSIGEGKLNNIKRIMEHREYPQLTQSLPARPGGQGPGISIHPNQPKHIDLDGFIKSSLNILEEGQRADKKELKRERGNHYKAAAKTYGQIPATPRPPSVKFQSTTPRKPLLNLSTQSMTGGKTKRTHTPPTPPLQARRSKSVAYEAQAAALAGSDEQRPVLSRSKTAPGQVEMVGKHGKENRNEKEDEKAVKESLPVAPKSDNLAPRMKAWVEGATDFEKDVAYNMLQSLNGNQPVPRPAAPATSMMNQGRMGPANSRVPAATHVYVPPSPAPRQPVPNRNGRDDTQVQAWMKQLREKLELQQPGLDIRQLPKSLAASHPQAPRKKRVTLPEEYRHENSHFMMTKPTYRRHFIIAPDWVSERTSHRRLQQQGWARKNRIGSQGVGY
ncbi:uncharacterized protein LOC121416331 isoform X3 [Lytechinus variegatus]|uniref:uncharacterized protein LOC121416331 isoform X3 n=1 Tax=Lytechinus variegatus TaxID=7654 RepID=UPI001BB1D7B3|nr:uncharacterized protein LOC121416331 isoform X3 [Lytechinus variegatus]